MLEVQVQLFQVLESTRKKTEKPSTATNQDLKQLKGYYWRARPSSKIPKPKTLNPKPETLNPKPETLKPKA